MGEGDRSRPTGTVSFLFTDIEGSTPLWERHPEAMRAALERHDAILREAIEEHGGFVFSTAGDAFSAAFHTPGDAVGAALDAQLRFQAGPWPAEAPVRVRMGVHLGTVQERDGDYFGSAVNRAARLMGLAHGGQVLVSLAVEELVRDDLVDGIALEGLGEHSLRGLSRPETVFQLTGPGLVGEFPPLRAATSVQGNLPSPPTSFVGRVEETKRLAAEIPTHRLVTLVGPGGVGKTRLAIEAAAAVVDEFGDGVWFVELAPVAEPDAVVHAVASTLSVSPEAGSSVLESIVDALSGRRVLVVLDNCEHVIDAAADIAAAVGQGAPKATILATSRERLGVAGERVWMVSALDSAVEAAELFCERAAAADQRFEPSDADLELIASICERLDGMPLAIELAAGRARAMALAQLADRLADRFRLLRASARGEVVERQATLRATVEWSYRLLVPDEQVLFDRLSVFAGSFDLDAAEAVCGFDPVDELDVVDLLGSLVDKSLVVVDRDRGRYRLLETLRQWGAEGLAGRGEIGSVADRHLGHYVEIVERGRLLFEGSTSGQGAALFRVEWDNLRSAVERALGRGDPAMAGEIARATTLYAWFGLVYEHGEWLNQILAAGARTSELLAASAAWAMLAGSYDEGARLAEAALAVAPSAVHPATVMGWFILGGCHFHARRPEQQAAARGGLLGVDCEGEPFLGAFRDAAGGFLTDPSDVAEGRRLFDRARRAAAAVKCSALSAWVVFMECRFALFAGMVDESRIAAREALRLAAESGAARNVEVGALMNLAMCSPETGTTESRGSWRDWLVQVAVSRNWTNICTVVEALAVSWAERGERAAAAVVAGYLDTVAFGHPALAERRDAMRARLHDDPEMAEPLKRGAGFDRGEVVAFCLDRLEAG